MAKKIVPAFGRLLDTSGDVAIKNNVMYALTDMCVRYASLVDPLIPQITACLKDSSLVVRKTTLVTLIHLLQEDYLKMSGRGAFFFRILQTLNDESDEIRHLTTFYVQQRLLKRQPKVMYQHFIEAIFHFNEYEVGAIILKAFQADL
jgi:condensin-2 complex subunit D3